MSQRAPGPGGLVVVDKPAGITSHDVVARVRRLAGTRRVGHGGTLDPMATGVLVVAVERATRLLTYVIGSRKAYRATIRLGQRTVTDDADGEVTGVAGEAAVAAVTEDAIRAGLAGLTGDIEQVPSSVSAIKVAGRRAYARVRAGEEVSLAPRPVTVHRLDVLAVRRRGRTMIDVEVDVECSAGTYIRAIARDLGDRLGVGGHLTALRRTAVGAFTVADAVTLEQLAQRPDPVTLPLAEAVSRFLPRRDTDAGQARTLAHGGALAPVGIPGAYAVFDPSGGVVAIVRESGGRARPEVVLAPAGGE